MHDIVKCDCPIYDIEPYLVPQIIISFHSLLIVDWVGVASFDVHIVEIMLTFKLIPVN